MSKCTNLLITAVLVFFLPVRAEANVLNLREAPFSAAGDGKTDDRPALARAFADAQSGDTVLIPPGNYHIVLTKGVLVTPSGVTLWGQSGKSKLVLSSEGGEHREFLRLGSDVTLEGITIERDGDFPAVLLPLFGNLSNVTLRNCRIIGNAGRFPAHYCHALQVGNGTLKNLTLQGLEVEDCSYGLFQANAATGTVDGVAVDHSRFARNTASDLEFNSPKGTMRNIVVKDCQFRDNLCKSAGAGFAVGFANVTNGRVENCHIQNYSSEALHVEDRSADILLTGNMIVAGSTGQSNGVIMVLSNSTKVTIDRNYIDARPNTNQAHLILVTAGGKQFANPSEVTLSGNVLVNGASTRTWYLQPGSGPEPSGNLVTPATSPTKQ
ncbi:MAG: hypothetical protein QOE70_4173 [Chthoniobacter sp.]|jgi:hypothetical protein|nr:hypothetical protein [Chthoniobacter sp.]